MQYSENKKNKNTGFYVIIGLCLAAIGITSFIAIKNNDKTKSDTSSKGRAINSEVSSYTESMGSRINSDAEKIGSKINSAAENAGDKINSNVSRMGSDINSTVSSVWEKATEPTEKNVSDVPYSDDNSSDTEQSFVLPINGNIIKGFSDEALQYDNTFKDMRIHTGIDIACEKNAQIVAAAKGTVTDVSDTADFSKVITVDHGYGLTVKYCGMGSVDVKTGDKVQAGDLIGTAEIPPCECMDEYHIHIECIKDGKPVSPVAALGF